MPEESLCTPVLVAGKFKCVTAARNGVVLECPGEAAEYVSADVGPVAL